MTKEEFIAAGLVKRCPTVHLVAHHHARPVTGEDAQAIHKHEGPKPPRKSGWSTYWEKRRELIRPTP